MSEAKLAEATRLESDKDFEGAIALLTDLVRQDPKCTEVYVHLAADSGILGRFRQAEQYARSALQIDPDSGRARYYLACALRDQGWLDEASEEMEKALILVKQQAAKGTLAEKAGVELPLFGWNKNVEQDAMALRVRMLRRKTVPEKETPVFIPIPGGLKTYRNERRGFEIDLPEDWVAPHLTVVMSTTAGQGLESPWSACRAFWVEPNVAMALGMRAVLRQSSDDR